MGEIDSFFDFAPGQFCMVKNWFPKHIVSSCVMRLAIGSHHEVYENFWNNRHEIMAKYLKSGDQMFIHDQIQKMSFWPEDFVVNYKIACNYRLPLWHYLIHRKMLLWLSEKFCLSSKEPKEGKILAFQGKPDMHEILSNPSGRYRSAPWLKKYWK